MYIVDLLFFFFGPTFGRAVLVLVLKNVPRWPDVLKLPAEGF